MGVYRIPPFRYAPFFIPAIRVFNGRAILCKVRICNGRLILAGAGVEMYDALPILRKTVCCDRRRFSQVEDPLSPLLLSASPIQISGTSVSATWRRKRAICDTL